MPATSGRVRMPHNNRMSTSNSLKTHAIWQTAIGHDPYANEAEKKEEVSEADREKARSVLAMAKSQNLTDGAKRDNFTAQMYQGLKRGKQRRSDVAGGANVEDPGMQQLLHDPSSSSEEEFIEANSKVAEAKSKRDDQIRKKHRKRKKNSSSNESDDSSSDDESIERKDRRKHRKEKRKSKRKSRSNRDCSSSTSEDSETRHRRKRRRKRDRKESSRKDER